MQTQLKITTAIHQHIEREISVPNSVMDATSQPQSVLGDLVIDNDQQIVI